MSLTCDPRVVEYQVRRNGWLGGVHFYIEDHGLSALKTWHVLRRWILSGDANKDFDKISPHCSGHIEGLCERLN